jgi:outer membrane protease
MATLQNKTGKEWFDISFYNGYVSGESKEIVYSRSEAGEVYTLSQLDWNVGNMWVMGTRYGMNLLDDRLHLSIDSWIKIFASKATMADRDWRDRSNPSQLTDLSLSSSELKKAHKITGELGVDSNPTQLGPIAIKYGLIGGYQSLYLLWKDQPQLYISGDWGGFFNEELGITYKQTFSIPYLGLQTKWIWNRLLETAIYFKIAPRTHVSTHDTHHLRDVVFDEDFQRCGYWMVGSTLRWNIWKQIDCDVKCSYEQLNTALGVMTIRSKDAPAIKYKGAGVFHSHQTVSLGITAVF